MPIYRLQGVCGLFKDDIFSSNFYVGVNNFLKLKILNKHYCCYIIMENNMKIYVEVNEDWL